MNDKQLLILGLGLSEPWQIISQELREDKKPHELHIAIKAERGSKYPCPECKKMCPAHDFKELEWRHLNFFQHHCYIRAKVPRTKCLEHGIRRILVPWARNGSSFTLLFEQAVLMREMPMLSVARQTGIEDKRVARIIKHYVEEGKKQIDLSNLKSIGLDETSSKRGHNYVTVFVDMDKKKESVIFATEGRDSSVVKECKDFIEEHNGEKENVEEVVCDMSKPFLKGIRENFPESSVTADWFHICKKFVEALNTVRKSESKHKNFPKHARWAVVKNPANNALTKSQLEALLELEAGGFQTMTGYQIKEKLSWIRGAKTLQGAKWRIRRFINYSRELIKDQDLLEPMAKALDSLEKHGDKVVERWRSGKTSARLEGLNSIFQAVRARARGYRNTETFLMMIYLLASPVAATLKST